MNDPSFEVVLSDHLLPQILSYASDDKKWLFDASQVCRNWWACTRRFVFRNVSVGIANRSDPPPRRNIESLLDLVQNNPNIVIHNLIVLVPDWPQAHVLALSGLALMTLAEHESTQNLRELSLFCDPGNQSQLLMRPGDWWRGVEDGEDNEAYLQFTSASASTLPWTNIHKAMRLFSFHPRLQAFHVDHILMPVWTWIQSPGLREVHMKTSRCLYGAFPELIEVTQKEGLKPSPTYPPLTILSIRNFRPANRTDKGTIQLMLRLHAPLLHNIQTLELDGKFQDAADWRAFLWEVRRTLKYLTLWQNAGRDDTEAYTPTPKYALDFKALELKALRSLRYVNRMHDMTLESFLPMWLDTVRSMPLKWLENIGLVFLCRNTCVVQDPVTGEWSHPDDIFDPKPFFTRLDEMISPYAYRPPAESEGNRRRGANLMEVRIHLKHQCERCKEIKPGRDFQTPVRELLPRLFRRTYTVENGKSVWCAFKLKLTYEGRLD